MSVEHCWLRFVFAELIRCVRIEANENMSEKVLNVWERHVNLNTFIRSWKMREVNPFISELWKRQRLKLSRSDQTHYFALEVAGNCCRVWNIEDIRFMAPRSILVWRHHSRRRRSFARHTSTHVIGGDSDVIERVIEEGLEPCDAASSCWLRLVKIVRKGCSGVD